MAEPVFTDRALQDAYRSLVAASPGGDHLDAEAWDAIAANTLDPIRRDAAFDHVVACDSCTRIWRGIMALQADAEQERLIEAPSPSRTASSWRTQLVPLAAAAALILVVGAAWLVRPSGPEPETLRNGTTMAAIDALMVAYAPDGVPAFVWAPVAGATRYRIEVFTDDGRPVWARELEQPPASWPAETPRAAGTYRWRVTALNGETMTARSPIAVAEIPR